MQNITMPQPSPSPQTPNRYWIHAPKAAGKTVLSRIIAGPEAVIIHPGCTEVGMRRLLQSGKRIILEEFREAHNKQIESLLTAADNGTVAIGRKTGTEVEKITYDIDLLIVVSEKPPKNRALLTRFHVIHVTPPKRR